MPENAISLEQARPVLNALPFPVFISTFSALTSPVFVNDALRPFGGEEDGNPLDLSTVSLDKLFTLDNSGGKTQRQWASLLQENLPLAVTCRSLKNERYKISLETLNLDGKPYVLGLISLFQEDVALTQAHHDFVSIMSHEFRTPLTSIRGFADTMLHYGTKLAPEQQTRFIKIIRDQSDRLSRMVENILIISKLGQEQKKPQARPVLLSDMISKVNGALQGKGVNVEKRFIFKGIDTLESLWVEPDSLEQVLLNLMDNAVKYSPELKTITVSAERFSEDAHRLAKIVVADEGDGINEEQLTKLFSKFYRTANHMTQQVEGSGLGLYITKTIVQRMGGQIGVESEVGKGSQFWFTVPLNTLEMQNQYRKSILLSGEASDEEEGF